MKNYKIICECWDGKNVLTEDDATNAVGSIIGIGAGVGGIVLRNKRQQMLFQKIMQKFPTSTDLKKFLLSQGKYPNGLVDNMDQMSYAMWVKRNIVKEGKFFRIMAQVLLFGLAGGVYNTARWAAENGRSAEESVLANS